ncbi:hypothetical protein [Sphingobium sp. DC-2]|uniref:hypothetical protein n=1 Tax=Sphingobium sp. DC-2 TaxID=1303256 RepID=UPI0004C3A497|nr:hypothetical protein [Sphingobium sp. DC-2]
MSDGGGAERTLLEDLIATALLNMLADPHVRLHDAEVGSRQGDIDWAREAARDPLLQKKILLAMRRLRAPPAWALDMSGLTVEQWKDEIDWFVGRACHQSAKIIDFEKVRHSEE